MSVRRIAAILLVAPSLLSIGAVAQGQDAPERTKVFNGKDFEGWKIFRCEAAVEDGLMVMLDGNGLIYLNDRYDDFVLEFKWLARNKKMWDSGVYFRCDLPDANGRRPWPPGPQMNLRRGMEGNVQSLADARSEGLVKPGQWNEMKLTVVGATAKLEFNGRLAWEAKGLENADGIIALQSEVAGGGQFEFKDIFVTRLKPGAK